MGMDSERGRINMYTCTLYFIAIIVCGAIHGWFLAKSKSSGSCTDKFIVHASLSFCVYFAILLGASLRV